MQIIRLCYGALNKASFFFAYVLYVYFTYKNKKVTKKKRLNFFEKTLG